MPMLAKKGIDERKENQQNGSERAFARGVITPAARAFQICNGQI